MFHSLEEFIKEECINILEITIEMSIMGAQSLKKEILERLEGLSYNLQQKVLNYIDSLTQKLPKGIPGKKILRFAGCISQEDLHAMEEAIREG
ncbi:MAG: hypothetical protein ACTSPQ_20090, partial [Candidatus Helarchaeota archaeon]